MTSFAVQSSLGAIAPLVSKDKGSMGNRMDCAGSHIKNNAVTLLETAAAGGAAVGATRVIGKDIYGFNKLTKTLSNVFDGALKLIGKITKNPDFANNTIQRFEKMAKQYNFGNNTIVKMGKGNSISARYKAAAVIAAVLLPTLGYIAHKHSYKSGQIDQKYTDKAQLQKAV